MKNVTRKDIAEKLGVSVSVVSRVINNSGYVSKEKREKVLKAAKEMGYVQNPVAMALQQNKTKQLLFFCEDLTSTYYNQMYHGMVRAAKERGYHVLTVMDENDFEMVKETITDGILFPNEMVAEAYAASVGRNYNLPAVTACFNPGMSFSKAMPAVTIDNEEVINKAIDYLIGLGHKKIGMTLPFSYGYVDLRFRYWEERMKQEIGIGYEKYIIDVQDLIEQYAKENNTDDLFTANRDGMALFDGGRKLDISGRHYFRLAIDGIPNISDKLISRINGDEVFVISVPLSYNGEIVGTIQKVITFEEMYKICSLSIFSSQGYMYVINREGYVILHSAHPKCEQKSDNYFRDLYGAGNPKASEQMKRDIRNNRNGFIETTIAGREIFSAYTPIEKIHDWYLITSVPNNAVSPNGNTVISIFYFILFVIVVIFTSSLTYFLWYKNKQRAQLEKIAFVDTVTLGDTYNKFLVDAQGILTQCPHKKFHIIKFDIDNFKYINNFYGFEFGDRILRKINESISQQLNAHELIARIYSDHFVILLENAAEGRLNALLSSIENEEITLYFSAGIYSVTDSTESINLMVDKAGTAARSIKGVLNKKFAYYTNKFEQITIHNEQLKRAVKQALKNDEFIPYYQPKVDINSGILVGGEALVRWKTREGKFIFPNEFIPMCEQTGLIVELDMIMYEKVLKFLKSFLEQGLACVPISVNFSRLHLMDSDFLSKIVKKQCEYGVPAHLIEIELTESAIFDNIDTIYAFTRKMHANGFAIAMDDFGSGYSSLNMLKDIPIDVLKIDKGFLSEAADNNRRNIIFSSIADMARKLNIKVVVEGVEHLENVRLMKECGCSIAQGYYFAKPMDEESFRNVFKEGRIC